MLLWNISVVLVEREIFITRQSPIGEKEDCDGENSWISDGLTSSIRKRRSGEGKGEGGDWREKVSASEFNVGVDSAKSEIKTNPEFVVESVYERDNLIKREEREREKRLLQDNHQ